MGAGGSSRGVHGLGCSIGLDRLVSFAVQILTGLPTCIMTCCLPLCPYQHSPGLEARGVQRMQCVPRPW